jgi:hypothetical protein
MVGFDVRKQYNNKSLVDGVYTSSRFVCAKAGLRREDKRGHLTKNPRAETRTRCKGRMGIMINRVDGNYELLPPSPNVYHSLVYFYTKK